MNNLNHHQSMTTFFYEIDIHVCCSTVLIFRRITQMTSITGICNVTISVKLLKLMKKKNEEQNHWKY